MPDFIAVQCFSCKRYQVCQKRKDSKFSCKVCGSKQSVRRVLAHSNKAADVRTFVQQANLTRGQAEEQFEDSQLAGGEQEVENDAGTVNNGWENENANVQSNQMRPSKWATYENVLAGAEQETAKNAPRGFQLASEAPSYTEQDEAGEFGEDFVTALPDKYTQHNAGKRKFRGNNLGQKPKRQSGRSRTHPSPSPGSSGMHFDSVGREERCDYSAGPHFKKSRTVTKGRRASVERSAEADGGVTQSRWGECPSRTPRSDDRFNVGDGMFTSLGVDEVVKDDIHF